MSKPRCKLIGEDGNIYNLVGIARSVLKEAGLDGEALEMCSRIWESKSYTEAITIIMEYVEVY